MISRREFIVGTSATFVGAGNLLFGWGEDRYPAIPGKHGMIVRSLRFLDLEMPVEFAASFITPVEHFYVRNHMHEPTSVDSAEWRLNIAGEVIADTHTRRADENGTAHDYQHFRVRGERSGVRHSTRARSSMGKRSGWNCTFQWPATTRPTSECQSQTRREACMFRGLDEVPGKVPPFIRSIPIEKATDSDTLVALKMNGVALTEHHGFPARALVPGWIGAASCKWLAEIKVLDKEFDGNLMSPGYRMPNQAVKPGEAVPLEATHPATSLNVKSLITSPSDNTRVSSRAVQVHGVAWAGAADIAKVEISTDSGATWQSAQLGKEHSHYAWRLWSYSWRPPKPGAYTIMSRATVGIFATRRGY